MPPEAAAPKVDRLGRILPFKWLTVAVVLWIYAIIVVGGYVTATGAARACELEATRYPLCNGSLVPDFSQPGVPQEYLHRQLSLWGGFLVLLWLVQAWRTQRDRPLIPRLTTGVFLLILLQSSVGALRVTQEESNSALRSVVLTSHLALATLVFGLAVVVAMLVFTLKPARIGQRAEADAGPAGSAPAGPEPSAGKAALGDYVALTKPRIVLLLLVTTLTGFVMAAGPAVDPGLLAATLLAGALVAGGAEALNGYWERETDAKMKRTMRRPVPQGRVAPEKALFLGLGLIGVSSILFVWLVNLLAATLALAGAAFYVLVYTAYLKPRTAQNIVIGGAAGGFPVLVGWAAASGGLAIPPLMLFALVFLWTPPHFWALALVYREDYENAGIPMLPVVRGEAATVRAIVWYSLALVAFSFAFALVGAAGIAYVATAAVLGGALVFLALRLRREAAPRAAAFRLFKFSGVYLLVLCVALMVSAVTPL
jgi:protoheme IX farnesyltransferase